MKRECEREREQEKNEKNGKQASWYQYECNAIVAKNSSETSNNDRDIITTQQ